MTFGCPSGLITASELAALVVGDRPPVILDVRWQLGQPAMYSEYLSAHIPRAQWCDLDADLADPPGRGGRHPLPDPVRLEQRVRQWGITAQSTVVSYDGGVGMAAARAWWVLRWAGLREVRVLDGGLPAWLAAGLATSQATTDDAGFATARASATDYVLRPGSWPAIDADRAEALARVGRLMDVRAPERFRGETEPMDPVAGRIPNAINLPLAELVEPDGRLKPVKELREIFLESFDVDDKQPIGVYCGSGVTASLAVLALHEAGMSAQLYPGSWSEWITDPSRPVATG